MWKAGPFTQMVVFGIWSRIVVPRVIDLREEILREFHCSCFVVHSGGMKMYHDLCCQYYWSGMKQQVGNFVRRCLTCQ